MGQRVTRIFLWGKDVTRIMISGEVLLIQLYEARCHSYNYIGQSVTCIIMCGHIITIIMVVLSRVLLVRLYLWDKACWLERRTRDRRVASSNPGRGGGRIFFSRVNFAC